ncbi:Fis family transcriptional regulator [Sulfuricella sp. T08]|uniref:response regulator n=1 Tax=Sulfuricella sp. T08 TaxID=1632857 RepID=UPI0006179A09|nr:response regulator [Sulfuricella sp. T08]GAO35897.1 Fis family transcriptional regulator [Sulfuricella sp. T08]
MANQNKILLVEDDLALRTMLRGILELNGYSVAEAGQRSEALGQLRADPAVEVVILDLGLPPFTHQITEGIQTLKQIQAEILPVKVVVLTGQDQEAAALEAIREGAFDFLAKPASAETILGAVRRAQLFQQKELELNREGITRINLNVQVSEGMKGVRSDAEERLVRQVLKETGFNVYQSAKRLGVKRENIYYFMKKFGIQRDD